jgi:hypothetical protein
MKYRLMILLLVIAIFPASRCIAATNLPASCGPDGERFDVKTDKESHPEGTPEAAKALVYMIGEGISSIGQETVRVGLDGAWVGANHGASYFFFSVAPGEHHVCANWQSSLERFSKQVSLNRFTAEAGKVYYFRVRLGADYASYDSISWLDLEPINSDEGQYLVSVFAVSTSHKKK